MERKSIQQKAKLGRNRMKSRKSMGRERMRKEPLDTLEYGRLVIKEWNEVAL